MCANSATPCLIYSGGLFLDKAPVLVESPAPAPLEVVESPRFVLEANIVLHTTVGAIDDLCGPLGGGASHAAVVHLHLYFCLDCLGLTFSWLRGSKPA